MSGSDASPRRPSRAPTGRRRPGPPRWMFGWGAGAVVVAALVALVLTHTRPAVATPGSMQVGLGVTTTLAVTTSTSPPRTTVAPARPRVVVVTPHSPVTDSREGGSNGGDSSSEDRPTGTGTTSTTSTTSTTTTTVAPG